MRQLFFLFLFLSFDFLGAQSWTVLAPSGLRLRESPARDARVLASLPFGTIVEETDDPNGAERETFVVEGKSGHWLYVRYKERQGYVFSGFLEYGEAIAAPYTPDVRLMEPGAYCSPVQYHPNVQYYALRRDGNKSRLDKTTVRLRPASEMTEAEKSDGDFRGSVDVPDPDSVILLIGTALPLQEGPLYGKFTGQYWGYSNEAVFLYPEEWYTTWYNDRDYGFHAWESVTLVPDTPGYRKQYAIEYTITERQKTRTFQLGAALDLNVPASIHCRYLTPQLIWHGDLNRDGWLDCIFYAHTFSDGCGVSWYYHLFLSDPDDPDQPLKKVGEMVLGSCI